MIFIGELGGHCHGLLWGPQPIPAGIIPNFFGKLTDSLSKVSEIIKRGSLFLREWHELELRKARFTIANLGGTRPLVVHRHGPLWGPQPILARITLNFFGILPDSVRKFSEIIRPVPLFLWEQHLSKPPKKHDFQ